MRVPPEGRFEGAQGRQSAISTCRSDRRIVRVDRHRRAHSGPAIWK